MMEWRPPGYRLDAKQLVKALFSQETEEARLLSAAAYGKVELFADSKVWNDVLKLIMSVIRVDGKPVYTGEELGALKSSLPIVWI